MAITDRMWERAQYLTRFDSTAPADLLASLAASHFAKARLETTMGSNVPDTTPKAISTHFLDTGLGSIVRTAV
ncbi:hypothetical protein [Solidesulfovibrio sp.]